jgi:hypothetical protein
MDAHTLTRYRKHRRDNPLMPAATALRWAKQRDASQDWEEARDGYTREVDGFTVTLTVVDESIYPMPEDDYGEYVKESRYGGGEWGGNYPEPASHDWPLGLPYTSFHFDGCQRSSDGGYFVPDRVQEWYDHLRKRGQSRSVAWLQTKEWVEQTLASFFSGPLTYCFIRVTASREGVELGSDSIGTTYIGDDEGRAYIFTCVDEHGMVDTAIDAADDKLAELAATERRECAVFLAPADAPETPTVVLNVTAPDGTLYGRVELSARDLALGAATFIGARIVDELPPELRP